MKISEIITDKYKLRIPPTVYYDLLADVQEVEDEQEPTTKNDLGVDCISRADAIRVASGYCHPSNVANELAKLPSVTPQEQRWIPVSEKLPEPFTFVNATCRSLVDDRENWVVETVYLPIPKEANKHGYSDWGNIPMLNWGEAEVIAWVERIIPKPYKAESAHDVAQDIAKNNGIVDL